MKKVLIGCPTSETFDYCLDEFLNGIKSQTYKNHDLLIVDNSKTDNYLKKLKSLGINAIKGPHKEDYRERITLSRNMMVDKALEGNYDYLLSIDQDIVLPKDAIEKLMKFNKDIISGLYYGYFMINGVKKLLPLLYIGAKKEDFERLKREGNLPDNAKSYEDIKRNLNLDEVREEKLMEIKYCGSGCLLIKTNVLKKIRFGLEKDNPTTTDDIFFCNRARENNIKIFAFTGVKCKHMILKRKREID